MSYKDMFLATDIADSVASALPMGKCARDFYMETLRHEPDLGDKDFSSVYKHLEEMGRKE